MKKQLPPKLSAKAFAPIALAALDLWLGDG
jgi:hypothetical protein